MTLVWEVCADNGRLPLKFATKRGADAFARALARCHDEGASHLAWRGLLVPVGAWCAPVCKPLVKES
jgi:hypothetical protein